MEAEIDEWYRSCVQYAMIAAADVNGFIPGACHTVERDTTSEEGAAGMVDSAFFYIGSKLTLFHSWEIFNLVSLALLCSWTMPVLT